MPYSYEAFVDPGIGAAQHREALAINRHYDRIATHALPTGNILQDATDAGTAEIADAEAWLRFAGQQVMSQHPDLMTTETANKLSSVSSRDLNILLDEYVMGGFSFNEGSAVHSSLFAALQRHKIERAEAGFKLLKPLDLPSMYALYGLFNTIDSILTTTGAFGRPDMSAEVTLSDSENTFSKIYRIGRQIIEGRPGYQVEVFIRNNDADITETFQASYAMAPHRDNLEEISVFAEDLISLNNIDYQAELTLADLLDMLTELASNDEYDFSTKWFER